MILGRLQNRTAKAKLPLTYPYIITVDNPGVFKVVGKQGTYAGQGFLRGVVFGDPLDPLEITVGIDKETPDESRHVTKSVELTVPSQNLAFRFEQEGYRFYEDANTHEYIAVYDERHSNRRFNLGSIETTESNVRQVLDATLTEYAQQKDILKKLPAKFTNVGQLTKACYTLLEHLGLVERTGERRSMRIKRTAMTLKQAQEIHR